MSMKRSYIAKRFQRSGAGLSLDTEALAKYKDIIDLSIGDTDFTTDESIINAAFRDAKAGHTHYGDPKGDPELIDAVCRAWQSGLRSASPARPCARERVELPRHGARDARHPQPRRRGHRLLALLPHVPRADRAGRRRMRGRADLRERGLRHRRSASARRHHPAHQGHRFQQSHEPHRHGLRQQDARAACACRAGARPAHRRRRDLYHLSLRGRLHAPSARCPAWPSAPSRSTAFPRIS